MSTRSFLLASLCADSDGDIVVAADVDSDDQKKNIIKSRAALGDKSPGLTLVFITIRDYCVNVGILSLSETPPHQFVTQSTRHSYFAMTS